MGIGSIGQYGVGARIDQAEFRDLQKAGKIDGNFKDYDKNGDGYINKYDAIDRKSASKIDGPDTKDSSPSRGGNGQIVDHGKLSGSKTINLDGGKNGATYIVYGSASTGNSKDNNKMISISGGNGNYAIDGNNDINAAAKVIHVRPGESVSVKISSNGANKAQYGVFQADPGKTYTIVGLDDASNISGSGIHDTNDYGDTLAIVEGSSTRGIDSKKSTEGKNPDDAVVRVKT